MKRQAVDWEKMFAKYTPDEELYPAISGKYKEASKCNNKAEKTRFLKLDKGFEETLPRQHAFERST